MAPDPKQAPHPSLLLFINPWALVLRLSGSLSSSTPAPWSEVSVWYPLDSAAARPQSVSTTRTHVEASLRRGALSAYMVAHPGLPGVTGSSSGRFRVAFRFSTLLLYSRLLWRSGVEVGHAAGHRRRVTQFPAYADMVLVLTKTRQE